jgi:nucleotidyltransferase/DNA polymerase involved in DNA repair
MRAYEAKELCKDLICVQVPTAHGKADLTIYRKISNEVINIITGIKHPLYKNIILEKASIDEICLDVTAGALELLQNLSTSSSNALTEHSDSETVDKSCWKLIEKASEYSLQDCISYFISQKQLSVNLSDLATCYFKLAGDDMAELSMTRYDLSKGHQGTATANSSQLSHDWLHRPLHLWSYDDKLLLCGSLLIQHIRSMIHAQYHLTCTGGIAHNKLLAKIASAMHKPNKLTVFPSTMVQAIFRQLPITRVPGYNGKLGQEISSKFPNIQCMGEFEQCSKESIITALGGNGLSRQSSEYANLESSATRLLQVARGIDDDPVTARSLPKSIGCGKTFRRQNSLFLHEITRQFSSRSSNQAVEITADLHHSNKLLFWLHELSCELYDRCMDDSFTHNRTAQQFTVGVSIHVPNTSAASSSNAGSWTGDFSFSKVVPLPKSAEQIALRAYEQVKGLMDSSIPSSLKAKGLDIKSCPHAHISYLSLAASDFVVIASENNAITSYFSKASIAASTIPTLHFEIAEDSNNVISQRVSSQVTHTHSYQALSFEDIDPSVMSSLPIDVQEELRSTLRSRSRIGVDKNENPAKKIRLEKSKQVMNTAKNIDIRTMFRKL